MEGERGPATPKPSSVPKKIRVINRDQTNSNATSRKIQVQNDFNSPPERESPLKAVLMRDAKSDTPNFKRRMSASPIFQRSPQQKELDKENQPIKKRIRLTKSALRRKLTFKEDDEEDQSSSNNNDNFIPIPQTNLNPHTVQDSPTNEISSTTTTTKTTEQSPQQPTKQQPNAWGSWFSGALETASTLLAKSPSVFSLQKEETLSDTQKSVPKITEEAEKYGITPELLEFVDHVSEHPTTFINFPIDDILSEKDLQKEGVKLTDAKFRLSDGEAKHANLILALSSNLSNLRKKLVPLEVSEGRFWTIYFELNKYKLMVDLKTISVDDEKSQESGTSLNNSGEGTSNVEGENPLKKPKLAPHKAKKLKQKKLESIIKLKEVLYIDTNNIKKEEHFVIHNPLELHNICFTSPTTHSSTTSPFSEESLILTGRESRGIIYNQYNSHLIYKLKTNEDNNNNNNNNNNNEVNDLSFEAAQVIESRYKCWLWMSLSGMGEFYDHLFKTKKRYSSSPSHTNQDFNSCLDSFYFQSLLAPFRDSSSPDDSSTVLLIPKQIQVIPTFFSLYYIDEIYQFLIKIKKLDKNEINQSKFEEAIKRVLIALAFKNVVNPHCHSSPQILNIILYLFTFCPGASESFIFAFLSYFFAQDYHRRVFIKDYTDHFPSLQPFSIINSIEIVPILSDIIKSKLPGLHPIDCNESEASRSSTLVSKWIVNNLFHSIFYFRYNSQRHMQQNLSKIMDGWMIRACSDEWFVSIAIEILRMKESKLKKTDNWMRFFEEMQKAPEDEMSFIFNAVHFDSKVFHQNLISELLNLFNSTNDSSINMRNKFEIENFSQNIDLIPKLKFGLRNAGSVSSILTPNQILAIWQNIPEKIKSLKTGVKLIYSVHEDGYGLINIYNKFGKLYSNPGSVANIVVVRTKKNEIFGAFLSCGMVDSGLKFYGTGDCFVWRFGDWNVWNSAERVGEAELWMAGNKEKFFI
eukprot:TRINITY_DN2367_c0_g1_i1.p1 TRINITY_DN2367_c0_g1~~TRINITY_DN2367_c0_g1_i1.p1  ORF type:complete len:974 (-),score=254.57 TRINITY_DN2367_c0_g1_i1:137-3058(-)